MARFQFGGNGDITLHAADGVTLVSPVGTTIGTAWDSRTGGSQYTDLQNLDGTAISGGNLTATDGAEPQWLGPDGIQQMWVSWGSGRRYLRTTNTPTGSGGGGTSTPSANTALFVRKVPPVSGTGDGVWPARPTSDGTIMVFWDGAPNGDGSGPATVTTGTGGMRPGDKWLSHP